MDQVRAPNSHQFVQNWLSQIQRRPEWLDEAEAVGDQLNQENTGHRPWHPHNVCFEDPRNQVQHEGRKRRLSNDSSFIVGRFKATIDPRSGSLNFGTCQHERFETLEYDDGVMGVDTDTPVPSECYERRPRRKTRPDRYDAKRQHTKERKSTNEEALPKKRESRRKVQAPCDVPKNFSSDAILTANRLTV